MRLTVDASLPCLTADKLASQDWRLKEICLGLLTMIFQAVGAERNTDGGRTKSTSKSHSSLSLTCTPANL